MVYPNYNYIPYMGAQILETRPVLRSSGVAAEPSGKEGQVVLRRSEKL